VVPENVKFNLVMRIFFIMTISFRVINSSPSIVCVLKFRRLWWAGYKTHMGETTDPEFWFDSLSESGNIEDQKRIRRIMFKCIIKI
jgi:hypothetical protein